MRTTNPAGSIVEVTSSRASLLLLECRGAGLLQRRNEKETVKVGWAGLTLGRRNGVRTQPSALSSPDAARPPTTRTWPPPPALARAGRPFRSLAPRVGRRL